MYATRCNQASVVHFLDYFQPSSPHYLQLTNTELKMPDSIVRHQSTRCLLFDCYVKLSIFILLITLLGLITASPQKNYCRIYSDEPWEWTLSDGTGKRKISCSFIELDPCGTGYAMAYEVVSGTFPDGNKDSYIVCHDHSNHNTLYSLNILRHLSDLGYIRDTNLKDWRTGPKAFYDASHLNANTVVDNCYTKKEQVENFKRILNLEDVSQYVNPGNNFLARGHLSANADMVSIERQKSSYYYINSAPQWQAINAGNWFLLERAIRYQMLQKNKNPFVVFTGTYGMLTLPDVNNNDREIYMSFDQNNNGYIPVPKYFWKIVWEQQANQATAFIGINNPYLGNLNIIPESLVFCNDVCNDMPWFTTTTVYKKRRNVDKGYIFCCTVKELVAQLQYIAGINPTLLQSSLLL